MGTEWVAIAASAAWIVLLVGGLVWAERSAAAWNRRHEEEYQRAREEVNEAFQKQREKREAERLRRKWGVR